MEDQPELLTPDEIARELRVNVRTVQAWLKEGRLRGVRAGRQWRIQRSDLVAFLERGGYMERK